MGVTSQASTSRRGYLSQLELTQYSDITITDTTEADDQISQAEELVDAYVGFQEKFLSYEIVGLATAGSSTSLTLQSKELNVHQADFFKGCEIEIIGGTGAGQRRRVSSSTLAGVLNVADAWTTTPDSTSFYKIYQLGKFPRACDVVSFSEVAPTTWYKSIPENIKRAVAAQVEYMIQMGDNFFKTDQSDRQSESIGDYSYSLGSGGNSAAGINRLISPKTKQLLRGIRNITGQITT